MAPAGVKNYYEILGVSKDASKDEIRKAYLKLARQYHPDKTGGDKAAENKLKEINNAYDTLKNPAKRKEYDRMLFEPAGTPFGEGRGFEGFGGGRGFEGAGGYSGFGGFGDFFSDIFGGAGATTQTGPQPARGSDKETAIQVTLREVAEGGRRVLRVPRTVTCGTCSGSGAAPGTTPEPCPQCKGTGRLTRGGTAQFVLSQPCPRCRGTGSVVRTPCPACHGTGQVEDTRTVTVTIPKGVTDGTRLRLAGQGDAGDYGAPDGDLYVVVNVQDHPLFRRNKRDLLCRMPVTLTDALLGAVVRVPTLLGQAELRLPAGTQTGRVFRLKGQGLPGMRGGQRGDQLVEVWVEVPETLTPEVKDMLDRLRQEPLAYPNRRAFDRKYLAGE